MEPCSHRMAGLRAEQPVLSVVTLQIFRGAIVSVAAYLQYAEQCLALAAKAANPADKARLLQMAQAWRELAAKYENGNSHEKPT